MPNIMVSSTVRNIKPLLKQLYAQLTGYGYCVWMSEMGTIPVHPGLSNDENSVRAAQDCDCFLGIITGRWGSGIFANEIRAAISDHRLRWFLVSKEVVDARELLKQYRLRSTASPRGLRERLRQEVANWLRSVAHELDPKVPPLPGWSIPFSKTGVLERLDVLDLYDEVIQTHKPFGDRRGNWAQKYENGADVRRFVEFQFQHVQRVKELIATWSKP